MAEKKTTKRVSRSRKSERVIKYLCKTTSDNFLIELPESWKITFAGVNPSNSQREAHCIRVYDGTKLRAVYDNVKSFRDMSIPYAKENRKETGSSTWESDSEGNFSKNVDVKVDRQLVSGDGPFDDETLDDF